MDIQKVVSDIASSARAASRLVATCDTAQKNDALMFVADAIESDAAYIQAENQKDVADARQNGLSEAMIDRLTVSDKVIISMATGLRDVVKLPDPVGDIIHTCRRPNGLQVMRMRIPLGVVGIIYESRPNVTIDAAALCLKAGNAVILRGGSEALRSNQALATVFGKGLSAARIIPDAVQVLPMKEREAVTALLQEDEQIDLIIPRGGEGLIRYVAETSKIPVLKHYKGVCHVYVDKTADPAMAEEICFNAKVQRPGVCNAMETLLVHADEAAAFLPKLGNRLKDAGVKISGCPATCDILDFADRATEADWYAEYLDLTLSIRVVDDMDAAMTHIATYGSQHTDAIVTQDYARARRFLREVDSSAVMVNASTRFNDGGELGLGAEIGISTTKLHAFGPMGLEELTCTKFLVTGDGQIRT